MTGTMLDMMKFNTGLMPVEGELQVHADGQNQKDDPWDED